MTARCSFDPCAGRSCVWGTILNALRVALRINSGKNIYNFGIAERLRALRYPIFTGGVVEGNGICNAAFCESAALREKALLGASGLNSLSQSLTALTAPSGREPLARPGTLHFSGELSRHAKGPIPEGAVAVGDWGSWLPWVTPFGAAANFPAIAEAVPLGKVASP